ncbi:MAG: peptidase domain-containing ABC transporter [bacterium]
MAAAADARRLASAVKSAPVYLQDTLNECGLACLAMVAHTYKSEIDLYSLRQRFAGAEQALSLQAISRMAGQLGLQARGIRCELDGLKQLRRPAILHWQMDHFVVLVAVRARGCVIHDPNLGRIVCSWQEMSDRFTGVALELWPEVGGMTAQPVMARLGIKQLWSLLQRTRGQLYLLMGLTLALQILVLLGPWHVQWTVDDALLSGDSTLISVLCMGFALLLLLRVAVHLLRGMVSLQLGFTLSFYLGGYLLQHLLRLPNRWFEARHVGDVVSRFTSLQPVRDLFTQGLAVMLVDAIMVLLSLLVLLVYDPLIALVVVLTHGTFLLLQLLAIGRLQRQTQGVVVAQAQEQSHLIESVRSIFNVKAFQQENTRLSQWQNLHARSLQQMLGLQHTQLGLGAASVFVAGAELIVVIYLAAHAVLAGSLTVGMLFAFLSYRSHFTERLRSLVDQWLNLRTLTTHLERLADIWFTTPEPPPGDGVNEAPVTRPQEIRALVLDGVDYRHDARSAWLLKQAQLEIAPGEWVAVVGDSGCGKTTLLKLLMGFVTPCSGEVLLGQSPLRDSTLQTLRHHSACVMQGDTFFSGTIVENITLFETPDLARLMACLQAVGMIDVIEQMPLKHLSSIGDLSSGLSTGQMQRLVLARALYREPDYLFLDECTANLDQESVKHIGKLLGSLACTRVVVTHDWGFASAADRVFELRDGQLHLHEPKNAATQSAG